MNIPDITTIEGTLGVTLPEHLKSFLLSFQGFEENEINLECFVYIDVDRLIEMNRVMGFHGQAKLIKKKLIIGDNGGGDFYLIDLEDHNNVSVYVFDHEESVEENFDRQTNTWNWSGFESYDSLEHYVDSVKEMFG